MVTLSPMLLFLTTVNGEITTWLPMLDEGKMHTPGPISQFSPMATGPTMQVFALITDPSPTETIP